MPGPVARHLRRSVGERLHAQRVSQPPCRVHRHDAGPPPGPGRGQREGRRDRRLADAAGAAADHDAAFAHQRRQRGRRCRRRHADRAAHAAPSGTSDPTASASASASTCVSAGPICSSPTVGTRRWGRGSSRRSRSSCSADTPCRARRKSRAASSAATCAGGAASAPNPCVGDHVGRRAVQPRRLGVAGVDDHRAQLDPGLVLERVGRLDRLGDRQLLGQRDQDHPAPGRVAEQLDHVLGLGAQRAAPGRVHHAAGRGQERDGVPGRRHVDHDQVRHLRTLQLLDLAQDQDVPDAGDGGRHHVQHPRVRQPLGHALQPVILEILDQRVVRCQPPGPHPFGQRLLFVAQVVGPAEGRGDPRLALELDDEHRFSGVGGHPRRAPRSSSSYRRHPCRPSRGRGSVHRRCRRPCRAERSCRARDVD